MVVISSLLDHGSCASMLVGEDVEIRVLDANLFDHLVLGVAIDRVDPVKDRS